MLGIGPVEVFLSLGHWATSVYIFLSLHLAGVLWIGLKIYNRLPSQCPAILLPSITRMVLIPSSLVTISIVGVMNPDMGPSVEMLLDLVMLYGMMHYQHYTISISGGMEMMATSCQKKNILLPTWAPPCCLIPFFPGPSVTTKTLKIITSFPVVLGTVKLASVFLHVMYGLTVYTPDGIGNILSIISVPVTITTMYCFTMFNIIMEEIMEGNKTRLLGILLLVEYVLFDSQRGFFKLLTGTGMLSCVPPHLTIGRVEHLLKNCIKAFLATFIGIPYLQCCSGRIEM